MSEILHLRHEVKGGYKGCCRCSKRFLPYYVGSDGHWYCEDCGQELVKKKSATFGVLGDPHFKFNFKHPRCVTTDPLTPPTPAEGLNVELWEALAYFEMSGSRALPSQYRTPAGRPQPGTTSGYRRTDREPFTRQLYKRGRA